ncbi:cyun127 [Cyclophragma undans nucleopolyhedrovirus]|uniref:Cyun127 n=1 Tax=Cyclophragma undans nucleopolyhedrovirus TaxID=1906244 RepID=A0A288QAD1_9ABAC|nr:cyun127 [Cyclophragma undans nucleopolyhedrovirus]AOT85585.1 cyun127 [Cyclophragma undans nucleopolyhedrovirus]
MSQPGRACAASIILFVKRVQCPAIAQHKVYVKIIKETDCTMFNDLFNLFNNHWIQGRCVIE